jgi:hypothetical protein
MARPAALRWLDVVPGLCGWVVAGEAEAARFGYGDLDPARQACALKLHAFDLVPIDADAVLYADLDVLPHNGFPRPAWALQDVDFACVRDRWDDAEVGRVADSCGVPRWQYFNAGVWYARREAAPMLFGARAFYDRLKWYDQTGFNVARLAHRTRTRWLPWRCNAMDLHDAGLSLAASHAPHHAWPAWENGEIRGNVGLVDLEYLMDHLFQWDHPYVTDREHVRELARLAAGCKHVLEVGTFQGHTAWAMASQGAAVTTLDPANQVSKRLWKQGMSIDAMAHTGAEWLTMDVDGVYDLIFHDAQHGPEIVPELRRWWERILPGGVLAVHDAEQLEGWMGNDLPGAVLGEVSRDGRGRELLVIRKSEG